MNEKADSGEWNQHEEKIIKGAQEAMAFATKFAPALIKLRKAQVEGVSVTLTVEEACAIIEGMMILRAGPRE